MKALTEQQVFLLTSEPIQIDREPTEDERAECHELSIRGLCTVHEDDEFYSVRPTERGSLAMRIHEAYLRSRSS